MRDEAVASQDQDPTTEPAPAGKAPAGKDAGPSDASETIVSGSHAEGSSDSARLADTDPAEHDAWEAEFAGLTGSSSDAGPSDSNPSDSSPSDSSPSDSGASVSSPTDSARTTAAEAGTEAPEARESRSAAATGPDAVPGGHPSVAQRSTLPMRAASTMPDLSRYDREKAADADAAGTSAGATAAAGAAAGTDINKHSGADAAAAPAADRKADTGPVGAGDAEADATGTDRGPWYVSGTGNDDAGAGAGASAGAGAGVGEDGEAEGVHEDTQDEEALRRSEERERAATPKPVLARVIQVMIAVFFPVMLLAAAIRAVATPMFLWVEYYRPGFPADSFGFSAEDRMTYGSYAVDYLLNFASPRYLGDLVTSDGEPLYLATEVAHMADVKAVLGIAFLAALCMAVLSIAGGIYLARRCPGGIRRALFAGAVATLALIIGLLVAAVLAWEQFFTQVHTIFFAQGNWTFRLDDTLIRLFPSQFWMDAGGAVAGIVLLVSVLVLVFTWPTKRRRERSRLAREAARRKYAESLGAL